MNVSFGIGVKDLFLLFVLSAHNSPATPLKIVVSACLKNSPLSVLVLYIHISIIE
jgi:hypothetical protein